MVGTMTAIAAAASLIGGMMKTRAAAKANDAAEQELKRQQAANNAYRDRYLNADATQYADVQRLLTVGGDRLRRTAQNVAGQQAVVGGTGASVAAAKEQANQAYADMVSQAAATAQSRKDKVLDNAMANDKEISNRQIALEQSRSEATQKAIDTATSGVNSAASMYAANSGTGSSFEEWLKKNNGTLKKLGVS